MYRIPPLPTVAQSYVRRHEYGLNECGLSRLFGETFAVQFAPGVSSLRDLADMRRHVACAVSFAVFYLGQESEGVGG